MNKKLCIAKITTAHGIKGFVKLKIHIENPKDLETYNPLYIGDDTNETITITLKNAIKGGWVAQIDGITDRNRAEELRNTNLFIDEDRLPAPEEGEFYYKDLVGMTVLDNDKNDFGKVISTQDFGAGDLLEIKPNNGDIFFLPLNDDICPSIDKESKTIQTVDINDYIF